MLLTVATTIGIIVMLSMESAGFFWNSDLGLGTTRWQMVRTVVLPSATPGIMTGTILAMGRAIGEAAPLLAVMCGVISNTTGPQNRMENSTCLPILICDWAQDENKSFHDLSAAAIIVLLGLLLIMNAAAIVIRNRAELRRSLRFWTPGAMGGSGENRIVPMTKSGEIERANRPRLVTASRVTALKREHTIGVPGFEATVAVEFNDFNAWYGDFQAIKHVRLKIPANEITAFIGPSGCGKSTLLKWVNRMNDVVPEARADGTLRLGETDVLARSTDVVDLRRRVGMVFQKPNPFPKSVFDNVAYGPRLHFRIPRSELDELVEWSLRKAALWDEVKDRLHKSALGLSGGQQQRLCIARAIAIGPDVVLMDEPCSALDPASTARIEDLIFELTAQYTIVMVTHNMQQAARVSDRTAFFFEGRVVEDGHTDQVFTRPKEKQTEDYVTGKFG